MKKFNVTIRFSGGDEVRAVVEAEHTSGAVRRVKETAEYINFVREHEGETVTEIKATPWQYKPKTNTITITNAPDKPYWYYIDHQEAGIRLEFKKGFFNTHQRVWRIEGKGHPKAEECATALREIADWLQAYFPEMVSEQPKPRLIPKEESVGEPNSNGTVPCFFKLNKEVADYISEQAKARSMSRSRFVEWLVDWMTSEDK